MSLYSAAGRRLLFSLDPERAHDLVMGALPYRVVGAAVGLMASPPAADARLSVEAFGVAFANPLGLAAGLDKQGAALAAWGAMGFGAAEVGTVTPRPQPGNPKPRLFRLAADEALINRFGFNSDGARVVAGRLAKQQPYDIRVGVNIGKNKDTPNDRAAEDYAAAVDALAATADYLVINVSSPNTAGLRDLQQGRELSALVGIVVSRVRAATTAAPPPVLVKLSPDMTDSDMLATADAALEGGAAGLIVTNTTVARDRLRSPDSLTREAGGLSGRPLRDRANAACRALFAHLGARTPIVGAGGIASAADAYARIRSGATLVQIYTSLIYQGPRVAADILRGLPVLLERDGFKRVTEAIGVDAH